MRKKRLGQALLALLFVSVVAVSGFAQAGPPEGGIDATNDVGLAAQTLYVSTNMGQTKIVQRLQIIDDDTGANLLDFTQATIDNTGSATTADIAQVRLLNGAGDPLGTILGFPGTIDLTGYTIADNGNDTLQVEVTLSTGAVDGRDFQTSIDLTYDEGNTNNFVTGPFVDGIADTIERDDVDPAVAITNPADGDIVKGTVAVAGTATDANFASWSLSVDGTAVNSGTGAGAIGHSWNTALLMDGDHTLRLDATDVVDNTAFVEVTVTANNHVGMIGIFRDALWALDLNGNRAWDAGTDAAFFFGFVGDKPVAGDWDGDGTDEIGIFRNGLWALDLNGNRAWDAGTDAAFVFGLAGDVPVSGDWNGDGTDEIGIFRGGLWALDLNGNEVWDAGTDAAFFFGMAGDEPVSGDWDGDGTDEIGIFRDGLWALDLNGNEAWDAGTDAAFFFGLAGDVPVTGDWDVDGTDEIGIFRDGLWALDLNGNRVWDAGTDTAFFFGLAGDVPVTGDWGGGVGVGPASLMSVNAIGRGQALQVVCSPNPVSVGGAVTFRVTGTGIDAVQVSIYNLAGGLVYESEFVSGQGITWDLRSEQATLVANGIYLYAVMAKAGDQLITTELGRLLILR